QQVKRLHAAIIEAVEDQLLAIGRPPHGLLLVELFAIDPTRGAVVHVLVALGRDRDLFAGGILEHHVPIAVMGLPLAVGGIDARVLAAAARPADILTGAGTIVAAPTLPTTATRWPPGWRRGIGFDFAPFHGLQVELVALALVDE